MTKSEVSLNYSSFLLTLGNVFANSDSLVWFSGRKPRENASKKANINSFENNKLAKFCQSFKKILLL